jgi:hypothetical protein
MSSPGGNPRKKSSLATPRSPVNAAMARSFVSLALAAPIGKIGYVSILKPALIVD